jgi:Tfp pilus assembly protein PilF
VEAGHAGLHTCVRLFWKESTMPTRSPWGRCCLAVCIGLSCLTSPAQASPWRPADDAQVVLRLPQRITVGERAQRRALAQRPQDLGLAVSTAQAALARAARSADPRELGQAQAALAPWWAQTDPPAPVRLLRARILQSQHHFDAALADLNALSAARPAVSNPASRVLLAQALWEQASVLRVLGRLAESDDACRALQSPVYAPLGRELAVRAAACRAEIASLQGDADGASRTLQALARERPDDDWLALVRAELADRQGQVRQAGELYRRALGLAPGSRRLTGDSGVYVLAAYADWWLEQGRPDEALHWLEQGDLQADALMLRRAIAWTRLSGRATPTRVAGARISPAEARERAQVIAQALDERYADARQRGERIHQREQARLALDVRGDAAQALAHAEENWQHQKEPADALLLVRCAQAAGRAEAARPIEQRMQAGWLDRRLTRAVRPT